MCLIVGVVLLAVLFAVYLIAAVKMTVALILFLPWIVVGLIAGWLASMITESRHGFLADILIGLAGSIIGGVLYVALTHHSAGGPFNPTRIIVATVGAIIVLLVVKMIHSPAKV